jgi:hypothetical protein
VWLLFCLGAELNVAGDFDPEELEALVLRYLGEPCFVMIIFFGVWFPGVQVVQSRGQLCIAVCAA